MPAEDDGERLDFVRCDSNEPVTFISIAYHSRHGGRFACFLRVRPNTTIAQFRRMLANANEDSLPGFPRGELTIAFCGQRIGRDNVFLEDIVGNEEHALDIRVV